MLLRSHFTAFYDIKCKHFSNVWRDSSLYVIVCIRQAVSQELDKIHVLYNMCASFVDLLPGRCLRAKSLLGFDWRCAGAHQKCVNKKCVLVMAGMMTSCSTAILASKSILQILHLWQRDFHIRFCRKILRANECFDPEYKLGTYYKQIFFNSTKINFRKKRQKKADFMVDPLKTRGIKPYHNKSKIYFFLDSYTLCLYWMHWFVSHLVYLSSNPQCSSVFNQVRNICFTSTSWHLDLLDILFVLKVKLGDLANTLLCILI